jgi:phospholipid/cholesterol/gamma-HCH transport system permease protein
VFPEDIARMLNEYLESIGRHILMFFELVGGLAELTLQTIKWIFRPPSERKNIAAQMVRIGVESLPVAMLISTFIGMVLALQTAIVVEGKIKGFSRFIGATVSIAMVRELGPVITAFVVAGRIGSAIAAEIGTMKVTEQIDALETMATSPIKYLTVPRFVAGVLMMPFLTAMADLVGTLGGLFVSVYVLKNSYTVYLDNVKMYLNMFDIFSGLFKTLFFGGIITLVGCYKGFRTSGGAEGVGRAATESVVMSFILIVISDYILTSILF